MDPQGAGWDHDPLEEEPHPVHPGRCPPARCCQGRRRPGQLIASTAESKNKIAEIELQIIQIDQDLRAEVSKDLATIRAEIAETTEQKIAAEDVFSRIEIRAPQDGTVHEMSVHTVGGVVAAGEAMMLIVPKGDTLDVEARIPPEMIDQVHVGQTAVLRFSAFDQRTTPEIDGP